MEKFFEILELHFEEKNTENFPQKNEKIFGKSFCVTGSFEEFSRDEIHEMIENQGGEVRSSVSVKLDYLIAWEKAGSKMKKAEELGVEILSLEQFLEMLL